MCESIKVEVIDLGGEVVLCTFHIGGGDADTHHERSAVVDEVESIHKSFIVR